jgi:ABC-type uncharacterized transport system substrate-binding protein
MVLLERVRRTVLSTLSTQRCRVTVDFAHERACCQRIAPSFVWLVLCLLVAGCTVAKVVVVHEPEQPLPPPPPQVHSEPTSQKQKDNIAPVVHEQVTPKHAAQKAPTTQSRSQTAPSPAPQVKPEPMPVQLLPGVSILVSRDIPAYTRVASELSKHLTKRSKVYNLDGDAEAVEKALRETQWSDREQVVAIGLAAARAAREFLAKQVIFCQVFNYTDYDLITPWMKGVSMLPRFSDQLRVWKDLDPKLRRVALLTGANQQHLVRAAADAARDHGMEVVYREVHSDKETLYSFKRLAPEVQGLWLLPDNRVLSAGVIRALMSYAVRQRKEVLVFSPTLLKIGGLISIEGTESDVAAQVLARLQQSYGQKEIPGPDVVPLTSMQLQINARVAKQLGLALPAKYKTVAYEP